MTSGHTSDRLEACYRNLERVDEWIRSADNKAAALVTAESLLFALGVATLSDQVGAVVKGGPTLRVAALAFLAAIVSFAVSFRSVLAALTPDVRQREESLFFFGSIAGMSRGEFERRMKELSTETIEQELLDQTYTNAGIATLKFRHLSTGSIALIWSLGLVLVFLVLKGVAGL